MNKSTIRAWYQRWDGTPASLQRTPVPGRPRVLSRAQVARHVQARIRSANRKPAAIHYTDLLPVVRRATGTNVSIQTLRRYGRKELGAKQKRTKKRTATERKPTRTAHRVIDVLGFRHALMQTCLSAACLGKVSSSLCDEIATLRRRLQRISKSRVLFLDETAVRLSEAPTSTIVLPGEKQYVVATDTSSYAKRFDMIACVNGDKTFAPVIYTPKERSEAGVKGVNTEMLVDYILSTLGQETWALDDPPLVLVVDRARIHNEERVMEAFRERGGHVQQLLKMPPSAAKRLSPLDNSLFHDWKEAIRKHGPLTLANIQQVMSDEWNNVSQANIQSHYRHCGLMRFTDPYTDCPRRAVHQHGTG